MNWCDVNSRGKVEVIASKWEKEWVLFTHSLKDYLCWAACGHAGQKYKNNNVTSFTSTVIIIVFK